MNNYITTAVLATVLTVVFGQQHYDHQQQQQQFKQPPSAILSHKQALGEDGSFQYSFAADNGLKQGETISPDGSRKGAYSYVDPNGKTITVTYTADKNGFHVQGDHLPKPVQPLAPQAAPQQQYQPQQSQQQYRQQYQAAPQNNNHQEQDYDQSFNFQAPQFGGYGPATFPPAPPRQAQQSFPRPQYAQQQSQNYNNEEPQQYTSTYTQEQQHKDDTTDYNAPHLGQSSDISQSNAPHKFGSGYSFQFGG